MFSVYDIVSYNSGDNLGEREGGCLYFWSIVSTCEFIPETIFLVVGPSALFYAIDLLC